MPNPRQNILLKIINDEGYCIVETLAEKLAVSTQTIRRDIKKLDDAGLVIRHHGGASSPSSIENVAYEVRKVTGISQKNAIAGKIASLIPDNCTVFIAIGTTAEAIAKQLTNKKSLQVITNSLRVANILHNSPTVDVWIPCGKIKTSNGGIIGKEAMNFITNFRFDYFIGSAGSVDSDGTLLEYDLNEVAIAQHVIKSSRNVFLAMDSSKFIPKGSIELCHLNNISALFTDKNPPIGISKLMANQSINLHIC
jgi:DeoR/GlpR family transcriptional regulator of sugar metabolism